MIKMICAHRFCRSHQLLLSAMVFAALIMPSSDLSAQAQAQAQAPAAEPATAHDPMKTEGLDPKLARILRNYYRRTFSNLDNWESLQSVIFEGTLFLPEGKVSFTAHKKKPDLYKVVLRNPQGERIVMGYDGDQAWQSNFGLNKGEIAPMPEAEAKNFIRDASIGGHLLDPMAEGKQIEFLGVIDVDGRQCFELEVTLPDGQRIRSAIDILEYAERQQITTNNVNGQEERFRYSDFRVIGGVRFPFASTMESGGKVVHRVEMQEIRLNVGLIKSMFQPASEAHSTQALPEADKPVKRIDPLKQEPNALPFGESRFGESLFPDPQAGR